MIESGSMLLNGRRCGSLSLIVAPQGQFAWAAEVPGRNTLEDAIFDAHYKLDECIASRSPVEAEIAFLNHWLSLAETPQVALQVESPVVNYPQLAVESPIFAAAYHSPEPPIKEDSAAQVPIASVEFSTIEDLQDPDFNTTATRK